MNIGKNFARNVVGAILLASLVLVSILYVRVSGERHDLQRQVRRLTTQEDNSSVVKRISEQMEEIAYQQKDIAEKQREEAVVQSDLAIRMRHQAEMERGLALQAEKEALESYQVAQEQRALAIDKQQQAEYASRVADTLSYIALGRSLSSLSSNQYQAGKRDLAALLAYSSWNFTSRYRGDVYLPSIFNALSESSHHATEWAVHKGGITRIIASNDPSGMISVSRYGEIIRWTYKNGMMNHLMVFFDRNCNFSDVYLDESDNIVAISRDGQLIVVHPNGEASNMRLTGEAFHRILPTSGQRLLVFDKNSISTLALFNKLSAVQQQQRFLELRESVKKKKKKDKKINIAPYYVEKVRSLGFNIAGCGMRHDKIFLYGTQGEASMLQGEEITTLSPWTNGIVTSYAYSDHFGLTALGCEDGMIHIFNRNGQKVRTLVGHRSRVSQLDFKESYLFSSSYDNTLNLWNLKNSGQDALTVRVLPSWIYCFLNNDQEALWVGDESGTLTRVVISPDKMAEMIHAKLEREFTHDEWTYYMGSNTPYQQFINP